MSTERLSKLKQFASQMTGSDVVVEKAELFHDRAEITVQRKGATAEWMRLTVSVTMLDKIDDVEDDDPFGDPLSATEELQSAADELERLKTYLGYVSQRAEDLGYRLADAQRALADVPVTDHTEQRT